MWQATLASSRIYRVLDKDFIVDPSTVDLARVVADLAEIRKVLPQRLEFEQLTAIVLDDPDAGVCVGYKDVSAEEFWTQGHMPGLPLMPGVLICEAAAQLCTYQVQRHNLIQTEMVGFGGLDGVKFRGMVVPGDRLLIATQRVALRPKAMVRSRFQCFVGESLVCEGEIRGVPLPIDALRQRAAERQASL
jgi:3-hydroxyacyl-[acyl-carrier-protein] dehydratase